MTANLRSVPITPFCCCMPWHARSYSGDNPVHGAACCFCDRAVAAPETARGKTVACIYCGLDMGFIPESEIPPDDGGPREVAISGVKVFY